MNIIQLNRSVSSLNTQLFGPIRSLSSLNYLPLSVTEITFVKDFDNRPNVDSQKSTLIKVSNLFSDLEDMIWGLDPTKHYLFCFDFYPSIYGYKHQVGIRLILSKPILVQFESNPYLISNYIKNQLNAMIELYYLDDSIIQGEDPVIIINSMEIEIN